MQNIKAVLLDLDNTLYDYERCNQAGLDAVVDKLSSVFNKPKDAVRGVFDESRKRIKQQLQNTASSHSRFLYFQKTIESLKGSTDVVLIQDVHNLFWDIYFEQMNLFDGVINFFEQLKEKGIKVVIVSDLTVDIQFRKITKLGIDKYIDFVITSEEASKDKPAEPIFSLALEKLGLPKENIVFIGDDLDRDIQGAKNFGINYILADGNFENVINSFKNLQ